MYFAITWPCSTFEQSLFYFCSLYDWNGFYAWLLHFSMFLWIIFLSFPGLPNNFGNCLDYQNNFLDGLFFSYKLRKVNYTAEIFFLSQQIALSWHHKKAILLQAVRTSFRQKESRRSFSARLCLFMRRVLSKRLWSCFICQTVS